MTELYSESARSRFLNYKLIATIISLAFIIIGSYLEGFLLALLGVIFVLADKIYKVKTRS